MYKITIINWHEHNEGKKKHFKKTMIANNLISDAKVLSLTLSQRWLFINLLLIAGDYASDTVTLTKRQINEILTTREGAHNALDRLVQLQLVSYEKNESLIKEVKEKKEIKEVKEKKFQVPAKNTELNKQIWDAYSSAYFIRYKVLPVRNASVNGKISQIAKRLGVDAIKVVNFFLNHNDSFYLKSLHAIGLCLRDAESLHTQMTRGKAVTGTMVKSFEKQVQAREYDEQISKMFTEDENVNGK